MLRTMMLFGIPLNDVMFASKTLGEADIIREENIISKATSFATGKHH